MSDTSHYGRALLSYRGSEMVTKLVQQSSLRRIALLYCLHMNGARLLGIPSEQKRARENATSPSQFASRTVLMCMLDTIFSLTNVVCKFRMKQGKVAKILMVYPWIVTGFPVIIAQFALYVLIVCFFGHLWSLGTVTTVPIRNDYLHYEVPRHCLLGKRVLIRAGLPHSALHGDPVRCTLH